jgi:hypothetical protein
MNTTTQIPCTVHPDKAVPCLPASERGIALIVVLLLMAVLSGLATGFAMTGQVEVQMGTNEVYYAGARAAAEAGLNRAIVEIINDSTTNLLAGVDGLVSATPTDAVNVDNGSLVFKPTIGAGPYVTSSQYSYTMEILDDDNPALYESLTPAAIAAMVASIGENSLTYLDMNNKLILRATGLGPNGTTVRLARVIEVTPSTNPVPNSPTPSNPALLVNGDLLLDGNIHLEGCSTSSYCQSSTVHANGNLEIDGSAALIKGDAVSTGTFTANSNADIRGSKGGGRAAINVPDIQASDYLHLADYKLAVVSGVGQIQMQDGSGNWVVCATSACNDAGWTYSGGTWNLTGNTTSSGTYYAEGKVDITGSPKGASGSNLAVSIIATGSISIHGKPKFTPENTEKIQFVTDGDLLIGGSLDADADIANVEGQIMVREQFEVGGNLNFQGRVVVQNVTSVDSGVTQNRVHGGPTITYDGTLDPIYTPVPPTMVTTYVNNISGWIEQ